MDSLVVAYLIGWLAVGGYLIWLTVQQRQLAQRLEQVQRCQQEQLAPRSYRNAA